MSAGDVSSLRDRGSWRRATAATALRARRGTPTRRIAETANVTGAARCLCVCTIRGWPEGQPVHHKQVEGCSASTGLEFDAGRRAAPSRAPRRWRQRSLGAARTARARRRARVGGRISRSADLRTTHCCTGGASRGSDRGSRSFSVLRRRRRRLAARGLAVEDNARSDSATPSDSARASFSVRVFLSTSLTDAHSAHFGAAGSALPHRASPCRPSGTARRRRSCASRRGSGRRAPTARAAALQLLELAAQPHVLVGGRLLVARRVEQGRLCPVDGRRERSPTPRRPTRGRAARRRRVRHRGAPARAPARPSSAAGGAAACWWWGPRGGAARAAAHLRFARLRAAGGGAPARRRLARCRARRHWRRRRGDAEG